MLLTDTVGFVRKLPHQLVEAFRTTLDVVTEADLLLQVVDGSGPDPDGAMAAVHAVLEEIGGGGIPELVVFNKSDLGSSAARLAAAHPGSVAISATTGEGTDELLARIGDRLRAQMGTSVLDVPWDRGDVLAAVHRAAEVLSEVPGSDSMRVTARMADEDARRFAAFAVTESAEGTQG
ncbi:MAG: hypothetical protein M5U19_15520 [Microthrixaceae bacterium]|nr:hypothetical protein [Microthrixaceae bacterium]